MAQTLKSKISKIAQAYSLTAIIDTAKQLQIDQADRMLWDSMSSEQKTEWFLAQCKKYNLTPDIDENSIYINELKSNGQRAYFIVFLPRKNQEWHLEIGGSYSKDNGGMWSTKSGLKGKELQIAEVMKLNKAGM